MIKLTEFDKLKFKGYSCAYRNSEDIAIKEFEKALEIKEDPQIYFMLAHSYWQLRNYEVAQEYAYKAIEKGYDAYKLYAEITVDNLAKMDQAMRVLMNGVEKHYASACFALAKLHIDNNLEPDMRLPFVASTYLELAYEYADEFNKPAYALDIYNAYKVLYTMYPSIKNYFKENKPLYYYKKYCKSGCSFCASKRTNMKLFNEADKYDDREVLDYLFERFDSTSQLIFGLMLYEEKLEIGDELYPDYDYLIISSICNGLTKNIQESTKLMFIINDYYKHNGVNLDIDVAKHALGELKICYANVSDRFKPAIKSLIDIVNNQIFNIMKEKYEYVEGYEDEYECNNYDDYDEFGEYIYEWVGD